MCRWCGRGGPGRHATRGGWWAPAHGGNSEVFIGALVEALPHRRRPRIVVVGEGVAWPVVPMPRRCVWHHQAARVAVSQLGGAQRDNVARRGL